MSALDMDGLKALAAEHEAGVHYSSTVPEYAAMVALLNAAPELVAKVTEVRAFLDWLVSMEDTVAGQKDRQTVTLTKIIDKARALIDREFTS